MGQNVQLETKVIKRFVNKNRQDRYLQFILTQKNRQKFINELPHFQDFIWSLFKHIDKNEEQITLMMLKKNRLKDKSCYVISFDPIIDTQIMEVTEAIKEVVNNNMGTILVFGDAEIVLYGGEEIKSRYISILNI